MELPFIHAELTGFKLSLKYDPDLLINKTAYAELSGKKKLFIVGQIRSVSKKDITASPFLISSATKIQAASTPEQIQKITNEISVATNARNAARTKNDKYRDCELYAQSRFSEGTYKSKRAGALAIMNKVVKYAKDKHNIDLTPTNQERLIYGWIRKLR